MKLLALLVKEALQHLGIGIASLVALAGLWVMSVSFSLTMEASTLLTAATGFVYYGMPFAVAFIVRRLVVLEYEQHTHDFLAALPVSAWLHNALKYGLGLVYCWVLGIAAVLVTAVISSRQELISASFLLQVLVQVMVYLYAWYGITFLAAHLGRYRATFWMLAIALMLSLDQINPDAWRDILWHAALAESLDITRGHFPLASLALSFAWGTAGTVLGYGLGVYQQGAVVASWYRPMSTREKTVLIIVVVVSWLAIDIIDEFYTAGGPAYTRLTDVAEGPVTVRVSGGERVQALGARLGQQLKTYGEATGDTDWPTVVLVPVLQDAEIAVDVRSNDHDELVLELDLERTDHALILGSMAWAIDDRTSELPRLRSSLSWVAAGAARWWMGPDPEQPNIHELRAGYAVTQGISVALLADGMLQRHKLGPDVAEAVGWVGLQTLEELRGREAVIELLTRGLQRRNRTNLLGAVYTDLLDGEALVEEIYGGWSNEFHAAWMKRLRAHQVAHAAEIEAFRPHWGQLRRTTGSEADVVIESLWVGPIPPDTRVSWHEVDPLHRRPVWGDGVDDKERELTKPMQRIPTPVDARRNVAVTYRVYVDAVAGELWSGLEVVP